MSNDSIIDEAIKNTVTAEDVAIAAQKYTNDKSVKVLCYNIIDFAEGKLGFLGSHRNLKVTLQRSNASNPETVGFFVKSMPYSCKEQADFMINEGVFVKESNFFSKIVPDLTKNCKSPQWAAKCYFAKKDSMILEDLKSQGYRLLDKSFDDTVAIKSALASLARLHSCSIIAEDRLNCNSKHPVTLKEHYPGYFDEKMFVRNGKMDRWCTCGADFTCVLAKKLGYNPDKIRKAYEQVYEIVKPSKIHRNVICHGDPWFNNMMFADDSTSSLYKCVLVDYQISRYAPLVLDVLQFLHLNATRSYRDKHEKDLIKFYHSVLQETIEHNDLEGIVKVPTLEEIFRAMDDFRLIGLVTASLYFPIILLDSKVAAELTKDSDSFDKFIFGDRLETTFAQMAINESFKNKVEEAVIELAEECKSL